MKWRASNRRGQSVLEYLVVAGAVILAIVALGPIVGNRMTGLGGEAANRIDAAKTQLGGIVVGNQ